MKTMIMLFYYHQKWCVLSSTYDNIDEFISSVALPLKLKYKKHDLPVRPFMMDDDVYSWATSKPVTTEPTYWIDPDALNIKLEYIGENNLCNITTFSFDPNVRINNGQTFVGFEDLKSGKIKGPGQNILLMEEESGLRVDATIAEVDQEKAIVYCNINWEAHV